MNRNRLLSKEVVANFRSFPPLRTLAVAAALFSLGVVDIGEWFDGAGPGWRVLCTILPRRLYSAGWSARIRLFRAIVFQSDWPHLLRWYWTLRICMVATQAAIWLTHLNTLDEETIARRIELIPNGQLLSALIKKWTYIAKFWGSEHATEFMTNVASDVGLRLVHSYDHSAVFWFIT